MDSNTKREQQLERQLARIQKMRAKGRWHFILWYGVIGWGITTGLLFAAFTAWKEGGDSFLLQLVIALILFPIGGIFWGMFMWNWRERQWKKLETNDSA